MEKSVTIYGLYSTRNTEDIKYVGKTVGLPKTRLSEHLREAKSGNNIKSRWINRELKYGYKIKMQIIDNVDKKDWEHKEKYYISLYRERGFKLVNISPGGLEAKHSVPIISIDPQKNIIKKFSSIREASKYYKYPENAIREVVKHRLTNYNKIIFIDLKEYDTNKVYEIIKGPDKHNIPVYQYSLEGAFIRGWDSAVEAGSDLNITTISQVTGGLQKTAGGFQWSKTKVDALPKINYIPDQTSSNARYISTFKDGVEILTNKTIKETSELLDIKIKGIGKVLYGRNKTHKGYTFK